MRSGTSRSGFKLASYKRGETVIPGEYWLWPLYGSGFGNLGVDDGPIQVGTPFCGSDQLLVRHDAVGLCFSDTKVIKVGEAHPRLGGRDMKADPVVLGHEVALTLLQVGDGLVDRFGRGDRFIVQADIYYKGVGLAYGYALQGGLSQYNLIGREILEGDEGCYLLPLKAETGYAQAALTEPWACVLASYDVVYRASWRPGGAVLIATGPGAPDGCELGVPYAGGQAPARVVTLGLEGHLLNKVRQRAATDGFPLIELESPSKGVVSQVVSASGKGGFDDIVLLGSDAWLYGLLEPLANRGCVLNLVGAQALRGMTQVDVGRLHYDGLSLTGTEEPIVAGAYKPIRTQLVPGGRAAFLGAGGPMGQMHVQRALQADHSPELIVATDLVPERLDVLRVRCAQLAERKRGETRVVLRAPGDQPEESFNESLVETTGGKGFDDIVVLAPSATVVADAVGMLSPGGVMNIFAGLPRGTRAPIDLAAVVTRGVRFTGTSGSSIRDLRTMLDAAESGRLDPNLSVVAVSGLGDAKRGLDGVVHQRFPGKVVVYPQILDFPLTELTDLEEVLPDVYARLGPGGSWTVEAEAEFLRELLP